MSTIKSQKSSRPQSNSDTSSKVFSKKEKKDISFLKQLTQTFNRSHTIEIQRKESIQVEPEALDLKLKLRRQQTTVQPQNIQSS